MKTLICVILGTGLLVGALSYMNRRQTLPVAPPEPALETSSPPRIEAPATTDPIPPPAAAPHSSPVNPTPVSQGTQPKLASAKGIPEAVIINQAVDLLVSSQANYGQKQSAWKQLSDAGKLDQAISILEQRMAAAPEAPEYPSALGQAYLKKCAILQDVREQGILGMQADKLFDNALALDPSNWESRFTKAIALSYWPASMNKGDEVIQQFQVLIQQQEMQTPQEHFAESYRWLGEQYLKSGQQDYAQLLWARGASLFPQNEGLRNKLAALQAAQNSNLAGTPQ